MKENSLNLLLKDLKSDNLAKRARAQEYCKSVNNQIPLTHKEVHYPQPHLNDNLSEVSKQIRDDLTSEDLARIQYAQWQQKELNKQLKRSDAERYVGMLIKESAKIPHKIGEKIPRSLTEFSTGKDSYKPSHSLDREIDEGTDNYTISLNKEEKAYADLLDTISGSIAGVYVGSAGLLLSGGGIGLVNRYLNSPTLDKTTDWLKKEATVTHEKVAAASLGSAASKIYLKEHPTEKVKAASLDYGVKTATKKLLDSLPKNPAAQSPL